LAQKLIALKCKQKVLNFRKIFTPRFLGCYTRVPPERPNRKPPRARSASLEGPHPLEQGPPRSRVHAPSSGFRLARGSLPHERTCSHARVRAFKALTPRHHAPGNHTPALFRQLPRGSPSPPLRGTVRRGRCQFRDTVPPTPVRLMHRALEGGPVAPSNLLLVTLQGQTVTSGRREHHPQLSVLYGHPRHCSATPYTAATTPTLLGTRGRDAATPATVPRTDHRQRLPRARLETPRSTTTPSPSKPLLFKYRARHDVETGARFARTTANSPALYAIPPHVAKQCSVPVNHPLLGL
jgi:hypothetical protein